MQAQAIIPESASDAEGPKHQVITGFTPQVCSTWRKLSASVSVTDATRETEALRVLKALEDENCNPKPNGTVNCELLTFIKKVSGGEFTQRSSGIRGLSSLGAIGLSNRGDRRVSATIIFNQSPTGSITNIVEQYMDSISKKRGGPARMRNSITVDNGRQELSISAGSGADEVYSFSHSNTESKSLYVILYMGGSTSVEQGVKILKGFQAHLVGKGYALSTFSISTSAQENSDERAAEENIEDTIRQTSQVGSFAIDLLCRASGN
jgi:hypothetical protein